MLHLTVPCVTGELPACFATVSPRLWHSNTEDQSQAHTSGLILQAPRRLRLESRCYSQPAGIPQTASLSFPLFLASSMEALSGVASGMAVMSLSIQLIESVATIKTFIHNVKDSQKELERLVDLLDRLEGLLEDTRNLLERQSSKGQYLPMPSMMIFRNLQSCEKTLQPLNAMVKKLESSTPLADTRMARLKSGLRIGFKTKDIADLEVRIERDINFLHMSLGVNQGDIS